STDGPPIAVYLGTDAGPPPVRGSQLVVIEGNMTFKIFQHVHFQPQSATVMKESASILDEVAKVLLAHREIFLIGGIGNADEKEKDPGVLSELRARAVVKALVARGVDPYTLEAKGVGKSKPLGIASVNDRRVEFTIERTSF